MCLLSGPWEAVRTLFTFSLVSGGLYHLLKKLYNQLYFFSAGRWQGALVAIKIVDHAVIEGSSPDEAQARAYRESILSTSLAHPNVVATYKICTARLLDRNSEDSLKRTSDPWPAGTSEGCDVRSQESGRSQRESPRCDAHSHAV
jgi:hypothetical protein